MNLALNTEQDLVNLVLQLNSGAEDRDVFIDYIWNPKRAIELGLWPTLFSPSEEWLVDWMSGKSYSSIEFWNNIPGFEEDIVKVLQRPRTWQWKTLETWKKEAVASAVSLPLLLYAPELVYRGSKRPKTDMSLFRSPLSRMIRRDSIRNGRIMLDGEVWSVVPVTRYAAGMSKGLYYKDRPADSCGTFYYLEEESSTYLAYKTEIRAFNKTEAAIALDVHDVDAMDVEARMLKHSRGPLPRDLIMTVRDAYRIFPYLSLPEGIDLDERHYAGLYLELYAEEDVWDQPLCNEARLAGYDIVVLENMVGKYQVVTEVLDTRSREDSFGSLLYVVN